MAPERHRKRWLRAWTGWCCVASRRGARDSERPRLVSRARRDQTAPVQEREFKGVICPEPDDDGVGFETAVTRLSCCRRRTCGVRWALNGSPQEVTRPIDWRTVRRTRRVIGTSPGGGIGRHRGLKIPRPLRLCGFKSRPGHSRRRVPLTLGADLAIRRWFIRLAFQSKWTNLSQLLNSAAPGGMIVSAKHHRNHTLAIRSVAMRESSSLRGRSIFARFHPGRRPCGWTAATQALQRVASAAGAV